MADTPTQKPTVAFLGPPSSYTHQATQSVFSEEQHAFLPVETIKDVFDAVQSGAADVGVVPFENSTHGVVTFTLDNLADRTGTYADLTVCGEVYMDVHHFLLGYEQAPREEQQQEPQEHQHQHQQNQNQNQNHQQQPCLLAPLSHVQRVLSHPQAFGQTAAFFAAHLRGVDCVDVSSTSKAAETASADASGATAAVAAESAAARFGLAVLARWIEDRDDNTTRFFVLRRRRRGGGEEEEEEEEEEEVVVGEGEGKGKGKGKGHKSLVSFTVPHRAPGALAGVLDVFRKYGLNLTSINSLPSLIQPFQYLFFVEVDGSKYHDPEGRVKGALDEVGRVAEGWRWLGSWESAR